MKTLLAGAVVAMVSAAAMGADDGKGRVNLPASRPIITDGKGRVESKVCVPNVVGKNAAQAQEALKAAGLGMQSVGSGQPNALAQSPTAGSWVTRGATVQVSFGTAQGGGRRVQIR